MIVVDTNLLIYLLMPTPHFAVAEAIWTKDGEWVAPELVFSEFWNVLAGAARRKNCEWDDARAFLNQALELIVLPGERRRSGDSFPGPDERMQRLRLRVRLAGQESELSLGYAR